MSESQHGYAELYAKYLYRHIAASAKPPTLIECGILTGIGLAAWCDLFTNGTIIGLDIDLQHFLRNKNNLTQLGAFSNNSPLIQEFDQLSPDVERLKDILDDKQINIFIDDGLHTKDAIKRTLDALTPFFSETCTIFIEDNKNASNYAAEVLPEYSIKQYGNIAVATNF